MTRLHILPVLGLVLLLGACQTISAGKHPDGKIPCAQSPIRLVSDAWSERKTCSYTYTQSAMLSIDKYSNAYHDGKNIAAVFYRSATNGTVLLAKPAEERASWFGYITNNMVHSRPSRTVRGANGWTLVTMPFRTDEKECTFFTAYLSPTSTGYKNLVDAFVCGGETRAEHDGIFDSLVKGLSVSST